MEIKKKIKIIITSLMIVSSTADLAETTTDSTPQPVSCINTQFSHTGVKHWQNIILNLTNQCVEAIDLNHAIIRFNDSQPINSVWYTDNLSTSYPTLTLSSNDGTYSIVLTFAKEREGWHPKTTLEPGQTVAINYGSPGVGYIPDSAVVYSHHNPQKVKSSSYHLPRSEKIDIKKDPAVPTPLPVTREASKSVSYHKNTIGRMIGYLPLNWNNSGKNSDSIPSPEELANAGYTDILVAFGIFNTAPNCAESQNCILLSATGNQNIQITSGDGTVKESLKTYIESLHQHYIKVLLSLGGASASFGTANFKQSFNQIQNGSRTFTETVNAYVTSLQSLIRDYGFDGIDIDIEHGFSAPPGKNLVAAGSIETCERHFSQSSGLNPQAGSVGAMTAIIKQMLRDDPQLMISLAPQTLNIAANNRLEGNTLNYSSLIANLKDQLSWVGVQVYNSGGMYGPDGKIQPITGDNQVNASVAMALNLLQEWKQGWPNYFIDNAAAILKPGQVVLGYPASNGSFSDGQPPGNLHNIKQALSCLNQGTHCDQLSPRQALSGPIGGVFIWSVNFDRANGYAFAKEMTGQ